MPDAATWWFDHAGRTYLYAVAVRRGDERGQAEEFEKLVDGVEDWASLSGVPEAGPVMAEHAAHAKDLVDAAFAGDGPAADLAVDGLLANVVRQTVLYGTRIPGFPAAEWDGLFTEYVASTGSYVLALAAGDAEGFKKELGRAVGARNALARLWVSLAARTNEENQWT